MDWTSANERALHATAGSDGIPAGRAASRTSVTCGRYGLRSKGRPADDSRGFSVQLLRPLEYWIPACAGMTK